MKALIDKIFKEKNVHSLSQQIITSALGFISFIILARYLDKANFGSWLLYITGCGLVDMIRIGLTQTAVVRFLSGAPPGEQKKIIGSNWLINLVIAVVFALLIFISSRLFDHAIRDSGYYYFFKFYPIYVFLKLPLIIALSILQARQRFDLILFIRSFESGLFVLFLLSCFVFVRFNIEGIIIGQLIIVSLSSMICVFLGWDGIKFLNKASKKTTKTILQFGKFSMGTMVGTNLLRSADTFIIGLSAVLGPEAVALFGIPLKMIEVIEVPLRSFSATLFPNLSKDSIENNIQHFKKLYYSYSGTLTLLIVPVLTIGFFFADDFMVLIGGKDYAGAGMLFKIFTFYGLMLPLDRFTGIALDSLNKPKKNFYKIMWMVMANIIGDVVAVFIFESLVMVAITTIVFSLFGLILGFYYLDREIGIEKRSYLLETSQFIHNSFTKLKGLIKIDK
ncbi:MAG: oligosaccharide flippase family protein [Bacteroidetes bacterium]|nr:oligosaccharide flippase family protein [Bacteroidota bacterium]